MAARHSLLELPMPLSREFERRLQIAFMVAVLVTALLAAITWKSVGVAHDATDRIMRTNEMLEDIHVIREATLRIEIIVLRHSISGNRQVLAERAPIVAMRAKSMERLEQLTADSARMQALLARLGELRDLRTQVAEQAIMLRETQGFEAARAFTTSGAVTTTRAAYTQVLDEMEAEERQRLASSNASYSQATDRLYVFGAFTALVLVAVIGSGFLMARRQLRIIETSNTSLAESNQMLQAARAAAERASAAKDNFLATMSHEIRTPLNGVMGMLELLSYTNLDREQDETLAIARESGRGLRRIIDDVLDHAKIEAGKLEIVPAPVSLAQLLTRVVNTYQAVASAKDLQLQASVDPQLRPTVMADSLRLMQVLGNFVSNSVKFTAEGGFVQVRAELVSRDETNETVRLTVKDTGIGMPPEIQRRLFLPFEQASSDTARLHGGTGLGLAITRQLVNSMGGRIDVDSAPDLGTRMSVTLTLPATDAPPQGISSYDDTHTNSGRTIQVKKLPESRAGAAGAALKLSPRVLAVDDFPTNRLLLARQLQSLGLRVHTSAGGKEALSEWQRGDFALVITDCNMPEMDGYALTRAIRDIEATQGRARTPVLAWTANAMAAAVEQCMAAGMDDVLVKPSDLGQLEAMVKKWLPDTAKPPLIPLAHQAETLPARGLAIDPGVLHEATNGDRELTLEIRRYYWQKLSSQRDELHDAINHNDVARVATVSHGIGGSSATIGATAIAAVCAQIEIAARAGDASTFASLHNLFTEAADRVMDELNTQFQS
jgi:signal transduction histidine kinase/DNA-binding response OmpR family regulator